MNDIYESINELLDRKENFVLATVLEKSGSAPGEKGTKMLIKKDFSMVGTIGVGLIEALTIKLSSTVFASEEGKFEKFSLSNNEAASLGMVCGDNVKVLLEFVNSNDKEMVDIYKKMIELYNSNREFVLITRITKYSRKITGLDKWICTETGFYGEENARILYVSRKVRENFKETVIQNISVGEETYLIEPFFYNENEGFTCKDLERVYSPIGIPIYADTPEEITISIVAELIKVRRETTNEKE